MQSLKSRQIRPEQRAVELPHQRLRFAHARGAKIQVNAGCGPDHWLYAADPTWQDPDGYRVHPDDDHLEYGPLSSALWEMAIVVLSGARTGLDGA